MKGQSNVASCSLSSSSPFPSLSACSPPGGAIVTAVSAALSTDRSHAKKRLLPSPANVSSGALVPSPCHAPKSSLTFASASRSCRICSCQGVTSTSLLSMPKCSSMPMLPSAAVMACAWSFGLQIHLLYIFSRLTRISVSTLASLQNLSTSLLVMHLTPSSVSNAALPFIALRSFLTHVVCNLL